MIKAIFFDVDGTLISHQLGDVPQSTRECLKKLKEKGIKIFISTGRHMNELLDLPVKDIVFDGYITLNGCVCLNEQRQYIYGNPFSKEIQKGLVDIFSQKQFPIVLVENKQFYINFCNEKVEFVQKQISTSLPKVDIYKGEDIFQATMFIDKNEECKVRSILPEGCKFTRWNPYGVDIISNGGGKVEGIKHILDLFHIQQNEIMAFGDGENDIDMLKFSEIGIAMGNAFDEVKEIADYITDHVDHDGILHALQHFGVL